MKKVVLFFAVCATVALSSCGNAPATDTTVAADSTTADTTTADTTAAPADSTSAPADTTAAPADSANAAK